MTQAEPDVSRKRGRCGRRNVFKEGHAVKCKLNWVYYKAMKLMWKPKPPTSGTDQTVNDSLI